MNDHNELLQIAIGAHGGAERWKSVSQIKARVRAGGVALRSRFQSKAFQSSVATVSTRIPKVLFNPYILEGQQGVFEGNAVGIIEHNGHLLAERRDPRDYFRRFRRNLFWDSLDALYFGGYALWNYLNLPFLLAGDGFEVKEIEPWIEGGERQRRLHVMFPDDVPSHSTEQVFYFNPEGLLVRHDYTAEVFGKWASAAHYSWDHREFGGLVVPTRRQVFPRRSSGLPLRMITLVSLEIEDVKVLGKNTPL